jgi:hypothetical protein
VTHTLSIDRVSTAVADVSVPQLVQADFSLVSTDFDAQTGQSISIFTLASGDPAYKTTITVRSQQNPRNNSGARNASVRIDTWCRDLDSVSGLEVVKPCNVVLGINLPDMSLEAVDVMMLVGNLYGLAFTSLTSKVPSTDVMSNLMFGLTQVYA